MTVEPPLPRKIWIETYEFSVAYVSPNSKFLMTKNATKANCDGMTDTGIHRISIARGLTAKRLYEVMWHEITHAINWANDIDDGKMNEEKLTETYGRAWTVFNLENPRMELWFFKLAAHIRKEQKSA